jgi:hypothetical protein
VLAPRAGVWDPAETMLPLLAGRPTYVVTPAGRYIPAWLEEQSRSVATQPFVPAGPLYRVAFPLAATAPSAP